MKTVILKSKDKEFSLTYDEAKLSGFIVNILEDSEEDTEEIVLPEIEPYILEKIVIFLRYQYDVNNIIIEDIPKPLKYDNFPDNFTNKWYSEFMMTFYKENKNDIREVNKLIMASNYLMIGILTNLCASFIASLIRGKTPEEVKELMDIK